MLTAACSEDLLALIGSPDPTVLGVESVELPASAGRLDNLLHLLSALGTEYRHLVEWQGYRDPRFLYRALGYLARLGLHRDDDQPLAVTLIYLCPGDDVGSAAREELDGQPL